MCGGAGAGAGESVAYACRHFRPGLLIIILWRKTTTQLVQMGAGSISGRRLCLMDERRDLAANQRAIYKYEYMVYIRCLRWLSLDIVSCSYATGQLPD